MSGAFLLPNPVPSLADRKLVSDLRANMPSTRKPVFDMPDCAASELVAAHVAREVEKALARATSGWRAVA